VYARRAAVAPAQCVLIGYPMVLAVMDKWFSMMRLGRVAWRTAPIFQKELRVASRRRRSYLLRSAYVLLLTMYIAMVWVSAVSLARSGAMSRAQMQVAAHTITQGIVWFQFFGAQAVVLLLTSTAISEEVYHRTLGILMTTPLSSRQVVRNKFFSRLFQVLLLVAASLPLLAVVRVLGGIAWSYVIVSLCVTAVTVIFVGSVGLFFSALCRRAHVAVAAGALTVAFLFVVMPILTGSFWRIWRWQISRSLPQPFFALNPYLLLKYCPNLPTAGPGASLAGTWAVIASCLLLLLGARLILAGAERLVGGLALRRAMGEPVLLDRLRRGRLRSTVADRGHRKQRTSIRRVVGPPMIWKELTATLSSREKFISHMALGVEITLILIAYLFPPMMFIAPYEFLHVGYVLGFLGAAVLLTITASASVISTERESGTWPVLLLTPLTDWELLLGKFVGVLRRCGPVWLALLAYVAAFTYAGCFHTPALAHVTIIILSTLPFLTATGFYFGSRFRRATEAVTATLVLAGVLWCATPILGAVAESALNASWNGGESVAYSLIPFAQAYALVATTLDGYCGDIRWFDHSLNAGEMIGLMLVSMVGYIVVALPFAWRAVRGFRQRML
jgi:ABC-type transport system involved in multi-copper enzyme maturation permease subunit